MKTTKMALGLFSGGFILFSIYKFLTQKRISKELISKIIKKISNMSIHFMFQRYDSQNKITNQKKEQIIENIIKEKKDNDFDIINNIDDDDDFDNEVLLVLLEKENEIIKSYDISNDDFQEYILEYKDNDVEIAKNFNLIQKVQKSFKIRKLPLINFGFIIPEKYLQIISNIFYFNLKKSIVTYYERIFGPNLGYKEKNEIFNSIYKSNLKGIRNEICTFFGIDKDNNLEINVKLALRIYIYYFDKEHKLRKNYDKINDIVSKLINIILKSGDKINVLIDTNNKYYIKEPLDKIIDFENILLEANSSIKIDDINNADEIPYEDQCD